jgi:hypothetical protein
VAGSDGCVLLSIRHRTGEPGHWYSPINDIASQTVVAARFRRKRHQPRDSLG